MNQTRPSTPPGGRPSYYGARMKQAAVYLTPEMIAWLKSQGIMGEIIRALIEKEMEADKK